MHTVFVYLPSSTAVASTLEKRCMYLLDWSSHDIMVSRGVQYLYRNTISYWYARLFFCSLFPVQQTTSGIGHRLK